MDSCISVLNCSPNRGPVRVIPYWSSTKKKKPKLTLLILDNSISSKLSDQNIVSLWNFLQKYYSSYQEEKDENVLRAADRQMKLMRILKDGIVLKVLNVKEELTGKNIPEPSLKDELGVMLVANLQEKQNTESRAVENILAEKVFWIRIFWISYNSGVLMHETEKMRICIWKYLTVQS